MPTSRRLSCVILLLLAFVAARAGAQTPIETDMALAGNVKDTSGAVMRAVTVRVFRQHRETPLLEATTDAQGNFAVALPAGVYRVAIVAPAFAPFEQVVTVPRREPLNVVPDLRPVTVVVEVTPDSALVADTAMSLTSRGFEWRSPTRCRSGTPYCKRWRGPSTRV